MLSIILIYVLVIGVIGVPFKDDKAVLKYHVPENAETPIVGWDHDTFVSYMKNLMLFPQFAENHGGKNFENLNIDRRSFDHVLDNIKPVEEPNTEPPPPKGLFSSLFTIPPPIEMPGNESRSIFQNTVQKLMQNSLTEQNSQFDMLLGQRNGPSTFLPLDSQDSSIRNVSTQFTLPKFLNKNKEKFHDQSVLEKNTQNSKGRGQNLSLQGQTYPTKEGFDDILNPSTYQTINQKFPTLPPASKYEFKLSQPHIETNKNYFEDVASKLNEFDFESNGDVFNNPFLNQEESDSDISQISITTPPEVSQPILSIQNHKFEGLGALEEQSMPSFTVINTKSDKHVDSYNEGINHSFKVKHPKISVVTHSGTPNNRNKINFSHDVFPKNKNLKTNSGRATSYTEHKFGSYKSNKNQHQSSNKNPPKHFHSLKTKKEEKETKTEDFGFPSFEYDKHMFEPKYEEMHSYDEDEEHKSSYEDFRPNNFEKNFGRGMREYNDETDYNRYEGGFKNGGRHHQNYDYDERYNDDHKYKNPRYKHTNFGRTKNEGFDFGETKLKENKHAPYRHHNPEQYDDGPYFHRGNRDYDDSHDYHRPREHFRDYEHMDRPYHPMHRQKKHNYNHSSKYHDRPTHHHHFDDYHMDDYEAKEHVSNLRKPNNKEPKRKHKEFRPKRTNHSKPKSQRKRFVMKIVKKRN